MLVGPRAAGKTTTAARRASSTARLDRAAEAGAFQADPDAALRSLPEPILLDEWQEVPGVLGAVKRAVDEDPRPGRFIITGSVRGDITGETWPGTGRIVRVTLQGMSVREQIGRVNGPCLLDLLAEGRPIDAPATPPDLRGYIELALRGGFPAAIDLDDDLREVWLQSYVDQVITRDAVAVGGIRDPARLRRYVQAYALNSAGVVTDQTLLDASGLDRKTATAYGRLLTDLFVVEPVPAWTTNRLQRLMHSPKRYVVDPSLVGAILRADVTTVMRDADLMGRLIDTFVTAQLRSEREIAECRPVLYHVRERQGRHEIDLLAEVRGQRIIACEMKATAAPSAEDARHLVWIRERLGVRFAAGVVFHTGPAVYQLSEQVTAIPIASIWN
jgi:predicted AAA+ superfamily ATPase